MSKLFSRTFVTSLFVLLMATSMLHAHAQSQSGSLSDEDEAEILESLLQLATKPLVGSDFGSTRYFSSENISSLSASRIKQHGFSLLPAHEIERWKREQVIDYVVISGMYRKDGLVVVKALVVTEGQPCFAPAFSRQRSLTYVFKKSGKQWVGRLAKRPPFSLFGGAQNPTLAQE